MTPDAEILAPPAPLGESTDPRRWLTLVILLLAAFMNLLDVSMPAPPPPVPAPPVRAGPPQKEPSIPDLPADPGPVATRSAPATRHLA